MFTFLKNLSDFLDSVCKRVGAVLLGVMVVLIVIQVVSRYVFSSSLSWQEEISRYLFIWVVMLGTAIGVHDGSHVAVEFLMKLLPVPLYKLAAAAYTICLCVLTGVMCWYGGVIGASVYAQLSPATRIPMTYVYAAVPVCSAVMLVHFLRQLTSNIFGSSKKGVN